jgi:hypothetical protein
VHDSTDIEVSHATFTKSKNCDDAVHVTYVEDFRLHDSTFKDNAMDGVDVEYSTATLERLTFVDTGDEPIDLMASVVRIRDSRMLKWGGSAISVGEESDVSIGNCIAAKGSVGIHVKSASRAVVDGLLAHDTELGARIEYVSQWYQGKTRLLAEVLHAVECKTPLLEEGGSYPGIGELRTELATGDLPYLRSSVLGLGDWHALDSALDRLKKEALP